MSRWNHPKQGFQKGHKQFTTKGCFKKGHTPWSKEGLKGIHSSPKTEFHKGMIPWNKGIKTGLIPKSAFKKGDHLAKEHPNWKGGRYLQGDSYVLMYRPKHPHPTKEVYVLEHRIVMEKHLGRYLKPKERIHHLNGKKNDNRIENLKLFDNESSHQKYHHKLKLRRNIKSA